MVTKTELDILAAKYETEYFIKDDPVQFVHNYKDKSDIELAGFIASLFSYGARKIFIKKLYELFGYAEGNLSEYIKSGDFSLIIRRGFNYRFSKPEDIAEVLKVLSKLYNTSSGLSELFEFGWDTGNDIIKMMSVVVDYFYANAASSRVRGLHYLLPNPGKGGAMKRMNMFLRWMVRKSAVDIGIWNFMGKDKLLIPLDVHVGRISREMSLLNRKNNDLNAVIELTNRLRRFDPRDPIKYDFAFFGKGIENSLSKKSGIKKDAV